MVTLFDEEIMERMTGIEPASGAWKALAIPDRKLVQKYRLTSLHLVNIVLTCCHFIKRTGRNTGKTRSFSNELLMQESRLQDGFHDVSLERVTGIEPALRAWKARILPLNYTRDVKWIITESKRK